MRKQSLHHGIVLSAIPNISNDHNALSMLTHGSFTKLVFTSSHSITCINRDVDRLRELYYLVDSVSECVTLNSSILL
jgi:hypothetical protein